MVAVAAPMDFPMLQDAAGIFVQQLLATAHQLNGRADQIENTLKQLYAVVDSKANQTELEELTAKVHSQETTEIVADLNDVKKRLLTKADQEVVQRVDRLEQEANKLAATHEMKASQQDMVQVTADITAVVNTKVNQQDLQQQMELLDQRMEQFTTALNTLDQRKADQQTALDLIATLRMKANQQDVEDLSVRVTAGEEGMTHTNAELSQTNAALESKANTNSVQEISAVLNAKANKHELRRFHRVTTVNHWRVGQKLFQQAAGVVVNDYRASMVMDIGYRYKMALQVVDHNRQQGAFIEAAVALLPESSSAWMNCDWGNGKGWSADGTFPGVGLMNLHGNQKSHILTSGDILDIALDHHTGQHIVEFRKRGSEFHCRRRVAPQPLNLVVSLWGRAGLELIEFDVVDVS